MLGQFIRLTPRALRSSSVGTVGRYNLTNLSRFSTDSHDDFKPVRKEEVPEGCLCPQFRVVDLFSLKNRSWRCLEIN
jgi:hypothetical protein